MGSRPPVVAALVVVLAGIWFVLVAGADAPPDARQEPVDQWSAAKKEELRRRQEWFAGMSTEKQDRIRRLHNEIESAEDADRLRRVMKGYCEWLKTLRPRDREELLQLQAAERIERIEELRVEQAERHDRSAMFRWMMQFAAEHETRIVEWLPEPRRSELANTPGPRRRWEIVGAMF